MTKPGLSLSIVVGLVFMLAVPGLADFQAGVDAYNRGDYDTALTEFRPLAEQGHAKAQYNLGLMYRKGQGVAQDDQEAVRWYQKAAEQGKAVAQARLGYMYGEGQGVPQDYQEAARWFRLAAEQGHALAQNNLGFMYETGRGVSQDYQEAVRWYRLAAEQEYAKAQHNLGTRYDAGQGVPQDYQEAVKWYRLAADQGFAAAQYNLGHMYNHGQGVPRDYGEAAKWYRLAAEQGHADAQSWLGTVYYGGRGVPPDYQEALRWYRLAADQGDAVAQYQLGEMYRKGQGVSKDKQEAARWYRLAAEQGQTRLANQYELWGLWAEEEAIWAEAKRRARKLGTHMARLSDFSVNEGVPQDYYQEAAKWYRLAAEQGVAGAQNRLGVMYAQGRGVLQDDQEAVRWYQKAADQGDAEAQVNVGVMYRTGRGVLQDYQEAVRWWMKAAEVGEAKAQYNLASMYYSGEGVPQDYVLAYMWANLAASQGGDEAVKSRDAIATFMTPNQIAEAQKLAREWKPTTGSAPDRQPDTGGSEPVTSGTGFVVSRQGHVLTNHHVIDGCAAIRTTTDGRTNPLTVVGTDVENDLAVLTLPAPAPSVARFRAGRTIRSGDGVVVVGFPLHGLLASEAIVTTGTVSALAGIGNDTRLLQITAPVQPGNSGGPLLDEGGHIVGIVVSKLNAMSIAKATGDIPQNINFAIKGAVAKSFLDSQSVEYETGASSKTLASAEIGAAAKRFTLLLECHR